MGNWEEKRVSELGEHRVPQSLDAVRAQIFYLASDIESVSSAAAMLLRAVAESIDDGDRVSDPISVPVKLNGVRPATLATVSDMRTLGSLARDAASASERSLGVVGSQYGYKR